MNFIQIYDKSQWLKAYHILIMNISWFIFIKLMAYVFTYFCQLGLSKMCELKYMIYGQFITGMQILILKIDLLCESKSRDCT